MSTNELQDLLDNNKRWAAETEQQSPGFFSRLLKQQTPQYLWIGCSDSRVPPTSWWTCFRYAVDQLKVRHIIIVGHSNCGGVRAALEDSRVGLADNWLRHVQDVRNHHHDWLETVAVDQRVNALCELNVLEQARNACQTTVVQDAWARGQSVAVHGWVYGLHNGLLKDLSVTASGPDDVGPAYRRALDALHRRYEAAKGG
ncbi:carbonic anhydrase domain-containing protein [Ditylenchus destructor]|nr:carbonic anhydrase domain-containing protein [Ditylenchus destructor]